jgi:hypothetical protein
MRCREQPRRRNQGAVTKVDPGPAKVQPVYCRSIIESPPSLTLLGETRNNTAYGGPSPRRPEVRRVLGPPCFACCMYEAPSGAPGRAPEARLTAAALLSNITYFGCLVPLALQLRRRGNPLAQRKAFFGSPVDSAVSRIRVGSTFVIFSATPPEMPQIWASGGASYT